jgi:hypothetical protein
MNSVVRPLSFDIDQPMERIFPLFSPEGEKLWVPGWDYENIMGTTELSEDYVFLTRSHDHATADAIWLVKRYEPEIGLVVYYRVEPQDKVGVVTIECSSDEEGQTRVQVTYKYIPLSARGQEFIREFTIPFYQKFIESWREMLAQYFESVP